MSLLIFLFYWIVVPVLAFYLFVRLLKGAESKTAKVAVISAFIATAGGLLWLAVGEKWLADRQVRALCAKDGGVRIHEVVSLTPDLLDKAGRISIPEITRAKQSDEYYQVVTRVLVSDGRTRITRRTSQIVRRADGKVLGERTSYSRTGGDLPGPWYSPSYICPDPVRGPNFEESIFVKGVKQ